MTLDIRWFAPAAIVAMVSADCIAVPYMSFAQAQEFIAAPVSLTAEQIQIKNASAWHSNAAENKAGSKDVKYDLEETGYGWKTDVRVEAKDTVMPTTCAMVRP